jgi:hypothetical protein
MNADVSFRPHFHIRWNDQTLDWEYFGPREEAGEQALFLKRPGETFRVEEVLVECPLRKKTGQCTETH